MTGTGAPHRDDRGRSKREELADQAEQLAGAVRDSKPVDAARAAAHDGRFAAVARSGYATSGALHAILGWLTAVVALGGSASADHSGALQAVASQPFGTVPLVLAGAACALLGLWQLGRTLFGRSRVLARLKFASTTAAYLTIAVTILRYAFGERSSSSQSTQSISAELMKNPAGSVLLVATGLVILGVAGYHVYKGVSRRFLKDLHPLPSGSVRVVVTVLGVAGYAAKGLVLASSACCSWSRPSRMIRTIPADSTVRSRPCGTSRSGRGGCSDSRWDSCSTARTRRPGPASTRWSDSGRPERATLPRVLRGAVAGGEAQSTRPARVQPGGLQSGAQT
nr:DUF1206 domain-containing protein [Zhihengliuella salsuginis]